MDVTVIMLQLRNDIVPLSFLVMMIYVQNGYEKFQTKIESYKIQLRL